MPELIDRQALIKDMCYNKTDEKCPCYPNCYPCDFSEARRIIDIQPTIEPKRGEWSRDHFALSAGIAALYELESSHTVNRWISVEDALPEEWKEVLVVLNSNGYQSIHIGEMQEDGGWMVSGEFWYDKGDSAITHWMPLPEIPKPPEKE